MRIPGAASTAIRAVTEGRPQAAQWLGAVDTALYFSTTQRSAATQQPPTVFAVLSQDAVRLPCSLVLATTTAELPLTSIAAVRELHGREDALVGDGRVEWTGPDGPVTVFAARHWTPLRVRTGVPEVAALAELRALLAPCAVGIAYHSLEALARTAGDPEDELAAVLGLLGRGPGLTPSGDDVLAGYLLAAHAFGVQIEPLRRAVAERAPQATNALSAQLLRHAARGEAVGELIDLTAALTSSAAPRPVTLAAALAPLLRVGHTSGAALACGVLFAGERAVRENGAVYEIGAVRENGAVLSIPNGGHR